MQKGRTKFNASLPKEKWTLSGKICLQRKKWDDAHAHPFEISFQALGPGHAMKVGLEKIKAFANREKKAVGIKKFMLSPVSMRGGSHVFYIRGQFRNNSILFAQRASLVFEKEVF